MNIKQVTRLLNNHGISVISTNASIEQVRGQGENYYKLRLNNDKWNFLFIRVRNNDERVIESFADEASASKYYYLTEMRRYFRDKNVYPFELNNADINIGEFNFNLDNLKEAFRRLNIDESYYSLNGKHKEHSIYLEEMNPKESRVMFIGKECKEVFSTLEMENWQAYKTVYQYVYYLYLVDKHSQYLLETNEIFERFTDEEYEIVLS